MMPFALFILVLIVSVLILIESQIAVGRQMRTEESKIRLK
jgi:hypothetical protein